MTDAPSIDALMAAQVAAEDAVLAQGLEVWSVADPATGEVVLHLTNGARLGANRSSNLRHVSSILTAPAKLHDADLDRFLYGCSFEIDGKRIDPHRVRIGVDSLWIERGD